MKNNGRVQGSAEQAKPLIVGKTTVYVHTNIRELPPNEHGGVLYEYDEVQYDKDEYIVERQEKRDADIDYIAIMTGVQL